MKTKLGIFLLLIFSLSELRPALPFVDYLINYDYIIEVLCIQKDKEENTCSGTCYLSQQIQETSDEEPSSDKPLPTVEWERTNMFLNDIDLYNLGAIQPISDLNRIGLNPDLSQISSGPPSPPPQV